jgi:hypothetical protein
MRDITQRENEERKIANEFVRKTHPAYYLMTILPYRLMAMLWDKHWTYTGQGEGAPSDMPLGPFLEIPLLESGILVALGLLGLLLRGRYPGFLLLLWLSLFLPTLYLFGDPRYRIMSELALMPAAAALVDAAFFRMNFSRRFGWLVAGLAAASVLLTGANWMDLSGPNLLTNPQLLSENPVLSLAVTSTLTLSRDRSEEMPTRRYLIARFPIDPGRCDHVLVRYNLQVLQEKDKRDLWAVWANVWPRMQMRCLFYDDSGTTLSKSYVFPREEIGQYQQDGATIWQVIALPGQTHDMSLDVSMEDAGELRISNLELRGPRWYRRLSPPVRVTDESEQTSGSAAQNRVH